MHKTSRLLHVNILVALYYTIVLQNVTVEGTGQMHKGLLLETTECHSTIA